MCACLGEEYPLMFIGQILYIWIAITEYVQSAFSGPPVFSGPDTCSLMKLRNLKMYNSVYKNDFTCISKTYLDYSTPLHDADI